VVDRITFALLLRKRQQPVMQLLQDIFGLILQFSKLSRQRALGMEREIGTDDQIKEVYQAFRKKVGVFISVCRGLNEKKGYGERRPLDGRKLGEQGLFDDSDLAEENTLGQLLARLEMSNYYSRTVNI
jgi:Gamma tubulin complex component C-terminal